MNWRALVLTGSLLLAAGRAEIQKHTVAVPMRDDIALATDLYGAGGSPKPVLLMRTPYNKAAVEATARRYAAAGYVVAVQDVRGRYASPGASLPYNNEGQDGFDTLEWLTRQPWCDGRVGMWGSSHVGAVQWQAAAEGAPGLAVLCPTATWSSFYRNIYTGGAARLALIAQAAASRTAPPGASPDWSRVLLHLPLADLDQAIGWRMPWLTGILTHPRPDGFWKRLDLTADLEKVNLPAQHVVGYYDFFCRETVANFQRLRRHGNQQLILGPWDHGTIGKSRVADVDFGAAAQIDLAGENLAWFDRFLRNRTAKPFPPVRYFSMGDQVWHTADAWPPAGVEMASYYLRSGGNANTRRGDGRLTRQPPAKAEPPDTFLADPADPVPAVPANATRPRYSALWGPVDQSPTEDRRDVLVYDLPLQDDLVIAGPIQAELWVSADTPDADWVVKLIDVNPEGVALNLAVGIQRASFRESQRNPPPLEPGRTYRLAVDMAHCAARLVAGHRLRVEVTGSCFPLYDRNTNTDEGPWSSRTLVSTAKVMHSPGAASRIILPVMRSSPRATARAQGGH
jgi:putative CocE/NonD family hydrolase